MTEQDGMLLEAYLTTPDSDIAALDAERIAAQSTSCSQVWKDLAQRYRDQGRLAQAESCSKRANYYQQLEAY